MAARSVRPRSAAVGGAWSRPCSMMQACCRGHSGCGARPHPRNMSGSPSRRLGDGSSLVRPWPARAARPRERSTCSGARPRPAMHTAPFSAGACRSASCSRRANLVMDSAPAWRSTGRGSSLRGPGIPNSPCSRVPAWCSHPSGYSRSMTSRQLSALSQAMKASFTARASGWWAANLMPNLRMWRLVVRSPWMMLASR